MLALHEPGASRLMVQVLDRRTAKVASFEMTFSVFEPMQETIAKLYALSIQMQTMLEQMERIAHATQADAGAGRHEP